MENVEAASKKSTKHCSTTLIRSLEKKTLFLVVPLISRDVLGKASSPVYKNSTRSSVRTGFYRLFFQIRAAWPQKARKRFDCLPTPKRRAGLQWSRPAIYRTPPSQRAARRKVHRNR